MSPERWQQIEQLYHTVLERAPDERAALLSEACAADDELRREVESLLASHDQAASFIEVPPDDIAAELFKDKQANAMLGRTFGHYELRSLLGAGGMGEVYRARDTRLDREVAVKILPEHLAQDTEALRRFEREAKAVAALSHPHILAIHDFGNEQGTSYAVMELLEGETLRARLKQSALSWREAVEITLAIAEGLAAAHAKGIIHRDLKPENIFLTSDGGVKILDFGIARVKRTVLPDSVTLTSTSNTTRPGIVMGTLGYMSPEQVRGQEVEAPSDIFSLGCVLYEMVSGQRPFSGETGAEVIAAILKEEPPPLTGSVKQMPRELAHVIKQCLEKRPEQRYQTARELALALRALLSSTGAVKAVSAPTRWRHIVWLGAVLSSLLLGLLVWLGLVGKPIDSLAILPLVNASKDAEVEYLSDGISESLINSLSQLPHLRVMARGTVFKYKGKEVDPRKVGQELSVRAVFTGRMVQRGEMLSIQADLVDAADGAQLWGERYDRKLSDVLSLQAEIVKQISENLRLKLSSEQQKQLAKRPTENTEANKLYLQARWFAFNLYTADGFKKGIGCLNQAIALDPSYALAHAGLAATYYDASGVWLTPEEAMPKAKQAALNALQLDETLAEAHAALAQVKAQYEWDWTAAGQHYRRALELSPSLASAHLFYGAFLAHQGRLAAGLEELKQAQKLDPLTPLTSTYLAAYYYVARQYDEAVSQCRKIIVTDPNFFFAHSILGLTYEQQGKLAEALAEFNEAQRIAPEQPFTFGYLGHAYALQGRRAEAQKMIAELERSAKRAYVDPFAVAIVYVGLGEKNEAFKWLEKAFASRSESLLYYKEAPLLDSLRAETRFTALLQRMNLAP